MKAIPLSDDLHSYIVKHSQKIHPILPDLAAETRTLPAANMQIAPDQGAFMHIMTKLIQAKRIVEVGCFTGYSAICMASALPAGGKLYTLDINPETTAVAQRYFALAGLQEKIELKLAPALDSLAQLQELYGPNSFDLMFIDADKENQAAYYEWGMKLVRPGGLILADNVLWGGAVIDPSRQDSATKAIRAFNDMVQADDRVDQTLLHISDGLYVIRKK